MVSISRVLQQTLSNCSHRADLEISDRDETLISALVLVLDDAKNDERYCQMWNVQVKMMIKKSYTVALLVS